MPSSGASIDTAEIRRQIGDAYDRFDSTEQARHVELLRAIRGRRDVALRATRGGSRQWTVTICTADRMGALSIIAGLFTAYRLNVLSAEIFTLTFGRPGEQRPQLVMRRGRPFRAHPGAPDAGEPARKTLDTFEVRTPEDAGPRFWEQFRDDLAALVEVIDEQGADAARQLVIDRVSDAVRERREFDERLLPVEIELDNDVDPRSTLLRIRSADTLGFLFEFANALALLGANIERADIRSVGGEARDSFWVTDAQGHKIVDPARLHHLRVAAALIRQFTHLLPRSPNPAQALRQFSALTGQMLSRADWTADLSNLESGSVLGTLAELMGVSRFLWEDFLRIEHDNLFPVLVDTPALDRPRSREELRAELRRRLDALDDHAARVQALNDFKDREMFRIDLRHITRRAEFTAFSRELSDLADVVVGETAALARRAVDGRFDGAAAAALPWCVCALGKCGGREMGFASDVELIFVYDGGEDPEAASRYFEECVREFLNTLKVHRQGVFEIDLRLRPYGNAGPLASSLEGFADYFSERGEARQFERMALAKLRPVAGDDALGRRVAEARDGWVYAGAPLDLANVRHLRRRQASELVAPGAVNAKYSAGGLVDVEYFVQARQIEAGHADPRVRVTGTLDAIDRLVSGGHMDAARGESLGVAYAFLRRLIDALRVVRGNARDLTIPRLESREFDYLARRLEYESGDALREAIDTQMAAARAVWAVREGG